MVNNEGFLIEDESSELDDDNDEVEAKKEAPKRTPSRALFGLEGPNAKEKKNTERKISLSTLFERKELSEDDKQGAEDKKKLTIKGSLSALVEKEDALEEDDKEKTEQPPVELAPASDKNEKNVEVAGERQDEDSSVEVEPNKSTAGEPAEAEPEEPEPDKETLAKKAKPEVVTVDKNVELEDTNWDDEGEISEEGEINLNAHANEETASKDKKPEVFAELPSEPPESIEPEESAAPEEPVEPELIDRGLGSEGPPEPPEDTPPEDTEDDPEEPPRRSASTAAFGASGSGVGQIGQWYNAPGNRPPNQEELDEAELRGRRNGTRSGLLAGGILGWIFGNRHGKKKAAKEYTKALKQKNQEIDQLEQGQAKVEQQLNSVKSKEAETSESLEKHQQKIQELETAHKENKQEIDKKVLELVAQKTSEVKKPSNNEKSTEVSSQTERQFVNKVEQPKPADVELKPELPKEQLPLQAKDFTPPEGRRVETSAWHRMELDEKTGKLVENPSLVYGKEFEREQKQEVKRDDIAQKGGSAIAAVGQLGSLATASIKNPISGGIDPSLPSLELPALVEKPDHKKDPHHAQLTAGAELLHYASMPLVWVAAVLIVIALFAFGLLH